MVGFGCFNLRALLSHRRRAMQRVVKDPEPEAEPPSPDRDIARVPSPERPEGRSSISVYRIRGAMSGDVTIPGADGEEELELAPGVGASLAEEILEQVFLHCPLQSQLRFLTLSRMWKERMTENWKRMRHDIPPSRPESSGDVIFAFGYSRVHSKRGSAVEGPFTELRAAGLFNHTEELWEMTRDVRSSLLDLSFCPDNLLRPPGSFGDLPHVRFSQDGLIMVISGDQVSGLHVINPFTRSWASVHIPEFLNPLGPFYFLRVGMPFLMVDPESPTHFKVIAVLASFFDHGDVHRRWALGIYSSKTGEWVRLGWEHHIALDIVQGWIWTVGSNDLIYGHHLSGTLLIYDLQGRRLGEGSPGFPPVPLGEDMGHPEPFQLVQCLRLFECQGDVYMTVQYQAGDRHRMLGVSKLARDMSAWGLPSVLPVSMQPLGPDQAGWTLDDNWWDDQVGLAGDHIWVSLEFHGPIKSVQRIDAFHIPTAKWVTLFCDFKTPRTRQMILFEPRALNVQC